MSYESLTVLIPSHSLEDLPLDLPEDQAEGLLNAFAVVWHPALLNAAGRMPRWARADDPPALSSRSLVIVPSISRDWLACQWIDDSQQTGANVVADINNRDELLQRCLAAQVAFRLKLPFGFTVFTVWFSTMPVSCTLSVWLPLQLRPKMSWLMPMLLLSRQF